MRILNKALLFIGIGATLTSCDMHDEDNYTMTSASLSFTDSTTAESGKSTTLTHVGMSIDRINEDGSTSYDSTQAPSENYFMMPLSAGQTCADLIEKGDLVLIGMDDLQSREATEGTVTFDRGLEVVNTHYEASDKDGYTADISSWGDLTAGQHIMTVKADTPIFDGDHKAEIVSFEKSAFSASEHISNPGQASQVVNLMTQNLKNGQFNPPGGIHKVCIVKKEYGGPQ
jgi:hypothetical protein